MWVGVTHAVAADAVITFAPCSPPQNVHDGEGAERRGGTGASASLRSWVVRQRSAAARSWRLSPQPAGTVAYGKLLATSKTSTMEKELQEASSAGFESRPDRLQVGVWR